MKKLLYAFLIAAVAAGCKDDEETFVHVEKVSIDVRELHLNPGKTYQLSVTIEPADATNRRIAWYSSNTNVATVDKSGLVTALAFGEFPLELVGASGAVMGLLLAFGVLHPNAVIMLLIPPIPMKAKWFVVIYGVIELFLGWRGVGNVAHFAHVGGMLWGFLLLQWWKQRGIIRF